MLLRYPGGKVKLYNIVKNIIVTNTLEERVYCEPFSGGFGLGLKLMLNEDVKNFIINDYDIHIYAFWKCVFQHTKEIIKKIENVSITIDEWHKQKEVYSNHHKYSLIDVGFSTLFLNRTNYSGILMSGPIGGFGQKGKYKLDCRFNKKRLLEAIDKISLHKNNVEIYNKDAIKLIQDLKSKENKIFFNFDPPYVNKGAELYLNSYVEKDHIELKHEINNIKTEWIMTYDNVDLIKKLYSEYAQSELKLTYSVGSKRKEKELIISCHGLKVALESL